MIMAAIEDGEYKEEKIGFWDNVYGFDMTCIKRDALAEPLVDTVEAKAVSTKPCTFKEIDIYTVKKEDLSFKVPFELEADRDDYIHAFLSWFDIEFNAPLKPVTFSTGPFTQYTHWKQTVFYTRETLAVKKGEVIKGEIECRPNKKNHRDLDIEISFQFEGEHCTVSETDAYHMC